MPVRTCFIELKKVFTILHGPAGCMWDKKQTQRSLLPHLREEVGEYIAAAKRNKHEHMKEELGDILLHVMFSAQIASKTGVFTIEDVIKGLIDKLKRRHPHVFGDTKVRSTRQIKANWNRIKKQEKQGRKFLAAGRKAGKK